MKEQVSAAATCESTVWGVSLSTSVCLRLCAVGNNLLDSDSSCWLWFWIANYQVYWDLKGLKPTVEIVICLCRQLGMPLTYLPYCQEHDPFWREALTFPALDFGPYKSIEILLQFLLFLNSRAAHWQTCIQEEVIWFIFAMCQCSAHDVWRSLSSSFCSTQSWEHRGRKREITLMVQHSSTGAWSSPIRPLTSAKKAWETMSHIAPLMNLILPPPPHLMHFSDLQKRQGQWLQEGLWHTFYGSCPKTPHTSCSNPTVAPGSPAAWPE